MPMTSLPAYNIFTRFRYNFSPRHIEQTPNSTLVKGETPPTPPPVFIRSTYSSSTTVPSTNSQTTTSPFRLQSSCHRLFTVLHFSLTLNPFIVPS